MQAPQTPHVPSLAEASDAMAQLATESALIHLEAALAAMQGLSARLRTGERLQPAEQRRLERSLLQFRSELRSAGILAEQGLAHCREWAEMLTPPATYQPNGIFTGEVPQQTHVLSVEA
ncbi:MAG TPA: hypothetical protein VFQ91_15300 [Bryobacteraceae bacterium]|nr:hypothetical protein [Bryobacteraceae bacterium]